MGVTSPFLMLMVMLEDGPPHKCFERWNRFLAGFGEITPHAPQPLQARNLSIRNNVSPFYFVFFLFVPSGLWKHAFYCYTATSLNSIWKINGLLKNRQDLDCHQETHKSKHVKSVMETERGPLEFSRVEAGLYTCPASLSLTPCWERTWKGSGSHSLCWK